MFRASLLTGCLALSSIIAASQTALGWSDMGHTIVGGVAEENINPTTKNFIRGILGVEPLTVAAIWPDHVRDDERFGHKNRAPVPMIPDAHNFSDYHFCEIPVGFTYSTRPVKDVKDCHGAILGAENILTDTTGKYKRPEKLIALRYLVHVMGDVHQPLHVGNGHDIGANACKVSFQKASVTTPSILNLHSFWDDNMVQALGESYADPAKKLKPAVYVNEYMNNFKYRRPEMFTASAKAKYGAGTLEQWLEESASLRDGGVYPDNAGTMVNVKKGEEYKNRPYCLWYADQEKYILGNGSHIDQTQIPPITTEYMNKYVPVVETQLLKAGLRLAFTLDRIAENVANAKGAHPALTDEQQEKILNRVQNAFENPN